MNPLIDGKSNLQGIVGIEVSDSQAEIFLQDGSTVIAPNRYWILSNKKHDEHWTKLKGNLHYQYGKTYKEKKYFYADKKALRQAEVDFFTISDPAESFMVRSGHTYYKGLQPSDISILSFDIETTGLEHNNDSKVLIISNTYRAGGITVRKLFSYDEYSNDGEMIYEWCKWVREINPSIICGHNVYTYDLPYMHFVASRYGNELELGRDNSILKIFPYESTKRGGSSYHKCRVHGRDIVDTMFLAINYDIGKKYESYALKKIIAHEKLEVVGRVFYDAATIRDNYMIPEEWTKIKAYAEHDADDALALFDLMAPAFFYLTQAVPKTFQAIVESATGSQINAMMIRSYLQMGHSLPKASMKEEFEGAISFGNPGIYRNAFKVDVASLYPNIMIQYEVYDKVKDPMGHMLQMVKTFTAERLKNKRLAKETGIKYYDDMQNAQKIVINSFYGFMGAEGLLFNYYAGAAAVTEHGRNILNKAIEWAVNKACVIINADTDSITFCNDNGEEMDNEYKKYMLGDLNSIFPERIRFEDDGYYPSFIVLAAKNYILFDGKKIKTKGSSLKDAKKERALKEFMNKIIEAMVFDTNHYDDIYNTYVKEAMNITDISRWSSKKTISDKVLTNDRSNEINIRNAIAGEEYSEGDKAYMYFKPDGTLRLADKFDGDYDKPRILEKIFKTANTFKAVIPAGTFLNYKLKRNQQALEVVLGYSS